MTEWISVEDRLPDHERLVLAAGRSWVNVMRYARIYSSLDKVGHMEWLDANNSTAGQAGGPSWDIRYWMPLPEPPK